MLGQANVEEELAEHGEVWDGEADLCRKILEERVGKEGWSF